MSENGQAPLSDTLLCGRCGTAYDPEDNFCRHCGLSLRERALPAVRDGRYEAVVWQPTLPAAVVKGAAFVAAGTLAELLVRQVLRRALRRRPSMPRVPARRETAPVARRDEPLPADTQMISETLFLKRVRFRR